MDELRDIMSDLVRDKKLVCKGCGKEFHSTGWRDLYCLNCRAEFDDRETWCNENEEGE